jgi:hypothetical protein
MSDAENPHAGQGTVMLDIGGDVGALVVSMPDAMVGEEVEIRPVGVVLHHYPHVAVHVRPTPEGGSVPSLVYPAVEAGRYELHVIGDADATAVAVAVSGGEVSTATWPA